MGPRHTGQSARGPPASTFAHSAHTARWRHGSTTCAPLQIESLSTLGRSHQSDIRTAPLRAPIGRWPTVRGRDTDMRPPHNRAELSHSSECGERSLVYGVDVKGYGVDVKGLMAVSSPTVAVWVAVREYFVGS
eukprot:1507370-Pyramimonas_sp.AAC.1